eukprot:4923290-Prymnesium_polylepis.2
MSLREACSLVGIGELFRCQFLLLSSRLLLVLQLGAQVGGREQALPLLGLWRCIESPVLTRTLSLLGLLLQWADCGLTRELEAEPQSTLITLGDARARDRWQWPEQATVLVHLLAVLVARPAWAILARLAPAVEWA